MNKPMTKKELHALAKSNVVLNLVDSEGNKSTQTIEVQKNKWEKSWAMGFKLQKLIVSAARLSGTAGSLFTHFEASAKMNSNEVYTDQKYLTLHTGRSKSPIYEALAILIEKKILIEFDGKTYLNPQVGWNGTFEDWQKMVKKLGAEELKPNIKTAT